MPAFLCEGRPVRCWVAPEETTSLRALFGRGGIIQPTIFYLVAFAESFLCPRLRPTQRQDLSTIEMYLENNQCVSQRQLDECLITCLTRYQRKEAELKNGQPILLQPANISPMVCQLAFTNCHASSGARARSFLWEALYHTCYSPLLARWGCLVLQLNTQLTQQRFTSVSFLVFMCPRTSKNAFFVYPRGRVDSHLSAAYGCRLAAVLLR